MCYFLPREINIKPPLQMICFTFSKHYIGKYQMLFLVLSMLGSPTKSCDQSYIPRLKLTYMAPKFMSTDCHLWVLHLSQGNLIHIHCRHCWVPSAFLGKHFLVIYSNGFMPSMCKHHIICLWYVVYMVYIGVSRFPVIVTTQWSVAKVSLFSIVSDVCGTMSWYIHTIQQEIFS